MVEHDCLLEIIVYDPATGIFTNRVHRNGRSPIGKTIGTLRSDGYLQTGIDGHYYLLQRLAWFYQTRSWPEVFVDHKDRVKTNNKWENLRLANYSESTWNQNYHRDSVVPFKGVSFDPRRSKFYARIKTDRQRFLGYFDTATEASAVYEQVAADYRGAFA